jgi:hypothetical protein
MADAEIKQPEDDPHNIHLRLSAQRALLGNVGPSVRAVSVAYRGKSIMVRAFVDPGATDAELDDIDDAATQVAADFPAEWTLEVDIEDGATELPTWPDLVFLRSATE